MRAAGTTLCVAGVAAIIDGGLNLKIEISTGPNCKLEIVGKSSVRGGKGARSRRQRR